MILLLAFITLLDGAQMTVPPAIPFEDVTSDANGQWITVTLLVNTAEDLLDGKTFYGCSSDDNISRSVCFREIVDLDERYSQLVSGRLRVIHHPPMVTEEGVFEGFTEYRLEQGVVQK